MQFAALRRPALFGLLAIGLAGCSSDRFADWSFAAQPASQGGSAPGSNQPPPTEMSGRWTLISPGHGQCAMNFGATPGVSEGTIAPEGGCPGTFFTSRKWGFEQTALVIRNHNGEPLAQLQMAGNRFDGKASTGEQITLTR